ncbi:MAG: hypothetical protein RLZZ272_1741 [Actinomycetota bacterium]
MASQEIERRIEAWLAAGLLTAEQAARLRAFEADATGAPRGGRRALAAEAVGYVGAAFALGALALLLVDVWGGLTVPARIAVAALGTVLFLGAGAGVRRLAIPAMQRLTSVLWTGAVGGLGWTVGLVGYEVLDLFGEPLALLVSASMLAVAVPLYALRRRVLLQLAVLATLAAVATSSVLTLSPLPPPPLWVGAGIIGLGLTWLLLGIGGWLPPAVVAEATGAVLMLIGAQTMSADDPRWLGLALGVVIAAALVVVAVRTDTRHPLFIGAFALFVLTPQLVFELFEDTIGAPATLLVTGLLLVLLAVGLSRARRDVIAGAGHADATIRRTPGGEDA